MSNSYGIYKKMYEKGKVQAANINSLHDKKYINQVLKIKKNFATKYFNSRKFLDSLILKTIER